ncbi:SH3 domain-binding glutamic acid-rich protein-like [Cephus cinctus]|uniref:SH3 domain-binding glutamic acid-rich protein-like n=1 Tax=Cephus cinctus TaxID=211228 RepID=A0AAJ7FKS5_CEPCN|nr:SH3 domain-binding glutamic acid-rich protein-like [Cephus cinctus]
MDRGKLWKAMRKRGIKEGLIERARETYKETRCRVRVGQEESEEFWTTKGVRQGCPLSPTLFNIYMADLGEEMSKGVGGVKIENRRIMTLKYASPASGRRGGNGGDDEETGKIPKREENGDEYGKNEDGLQKRWKKEKEAVEMEERTSRESRRDKVSRLRNEERQQESEARKKEGEEGVDSDENGVGNWGEKVQDGRGMEDEVVRRGDRRNNLVRGRTVGLERVEGGG